MLSSACSCCSTPTGIKFSIMSNKNRIKSFKLPFDSSLSILFSAENLSRNNFIVEITYIF